MDKLLLKGLRFYGFHGVYPRENLEGQVFVLDLELYCDLRAAGREDRLELTVDYDKVFHEIRTVVEGKPFKLLEALAEAVAQRILTRFPVKRVKVKAVKPNPPLQGDFDYFGVEIKRP